MARSRGHLQTAGRREDLPVATFSWSGVLGHFAAQRGCYVKRLYKTCAYDL